MADAEPGGQRHALAVMAVADALLDELLGDRLGELAAMLAGNQVEHQVECRDAARAGEAIAVDLEQLVGHLEIGKLLGEGGEVLPMHGAATAGEQSGAGQQVAAQRHAADDHALAVQPPEPAEHRGVGEAVPAGAGAHHQHRRAARFGDAAGRHDGDAVAGRHRRPVRRQDLPAVEGSTAHPVGAAQRLDRRGEAHHRELRHQQEGDRQGQAGGRAAEHGAGDLGGGTGECQARRRWTS